MVLARNFVSVSRMAIMHVPQETCLPHLWLPQDPKDQPTNIIILSSFPQTSITLHITPSSCFKQKNHQHPLLPINQPHPTLTQHTHPNRHRMTDMTFPPPHPLLKPPPDPPPPCTTTAVDQDVQQAVTSAFELTSDAVSASVAVKMSNSARQTVLQQCLVGIPVGGTLNVGQFWGKCHPLNNCLGREYNDNEFTRLPGKGKTLGGWKMQPEKWKVTYLMIH